MCASFVEPHFLWRNVTVITCSRTAWPCLAFKRGLSAGEIFVIPLIHQQPPSPVITTERQPWQLLQGTAEGSGMMGCWQVKRTPPYGSTKPVFTKLTRVNRIKWDYSPSEYHDINPCFYFYSWSVPIFNNIHYILLFSLYIVFFSSLESAILSRDSSCLHMHAAFKKTVQPGIQR